MAQTKIPQRQLAPVRGYRYTYDSTTANANPGTGKVRFDQLPNTSHPTNMYISTTDLDGNGLQLLIAKWAAVGVLMVLDGNTALVKALYSVNVAASGGPLTLNTGYYTVSLDSIYGAAVGTFTNGDVLVIEYTGSGTAGDSDSIQADPNFNLEVRKLRDESSDPGAPSEGELWRNTGSRSQNSQNWQGTNMALVGGISANNTASGDAIVSTLVETTFKVGGVNQAFFTLLANKGFDNTTVYRIRIWLTLAVASSSTLVLNLKLGTTTVQTVSWSAFTVGTVRLMWEIDLKGRTTGSTGTMAAHGFALIPGQPSSVGGSTSVAMDTTSDKIVTATATWGVSNAGNTIKYEAHTVERLF
jgi:hypothetical protein